MGSHTETVAEMLALLPLLALIPLSGAQRGGDFTSRDGSGPFFVADVPKDVRLAPDQELQDPSQAVLLRGQVGLQISDPGHSWPAPRDADPQTRPTPPQIVGRNCAGLAGALVEVWY